MTLRPANYKYFNTEGASLKDIGRWSCLMPKRFCWAAFRVTGFILSLIPKRNSFL